MSVKCDNIHVGNTIESELADTEGSTATTCTDEDSECVNVSVSASASVRVVGLAGLLQQRSLPMPHVTLSGGGLILCM
jgi:hypothetical protein